MNKGNIMNTKTKWIAVGATSVLGFGLLAGGAVASANTMPLNNNSGDSVGTGISQIDDRSNESPVLVNENTVTETNTDSVAAVTDTASPVSVQSAASAISPVSVQSAASPVSAQSPVSPVSN
jgi:hypothetical protein